MLAENSRRRLPNFAAGDRTKRGRTEPERSEAMTCQTAKHLHANIALNITATQSLMSRRRLLLLFLLLLHSLYPALQSSRPLPPRGAAARGQKGAFKPKFVLYGARKSSSFIYSLIWVAAFIAVSLLRFRYSGPIPFRGAAGSVSRRHRRRPDVFQNVFAVYSLVSDLNMHIRRDSADVCDTKYVPAKVL